MFNKKIVVQDKYKKLSTLSSFGYCHQNREITNANNRWLLILRITLFWAGWGEILCLNPAHFSLHVDPATITSCISYGFTAAIQLDSCLQGLLHNVQVLIGRRWEWWSCGPNRNNCKWWGSQLYAITIKGADFAASWNTCSGSDDCLVLQGFSFIYLLHDDKLITALIFHFATSALRVTF